MNWPHDDTASMTAFYGNPDGRSFASNLTLVIPPFRMTYECRPIKGVQIHKKCAASLQAVFTDLWEHFGKNQAAIDAVGLSHFSGSYNNRAIRGSSRKSCHAFGAAIDLDATANGLNQAGTMAPAVIAAFKRQGWYWGGDFKGRKDPMHFQAAYEATPLSADIQPFVPPMTDSDTDTDQPDAAPYERPDVPPPPPAPSTIVTARTVAGTGAGLVAGGQIISSAVGGAGDVADKITEVIDKSGQVVSVTKQVALVPKPGFWYGALHFITSPEFVAGAVVLIAAAWALVWIIQREHRKATGQ